MDVKKKYCFLFREKGSITQTKSGRKTIVKEVLKRLNEKFEIIV